MKRLLQKIKKSHKSLTIWFNLVGAGILSGLLVDPLVTAWLMSHGLFYVIILGNVLLRLKTDTALEDK